MGIEFYGSCNHDSKHTDKTKDKESTDSNIKADKSVSTNALSHPWAMVIKLVITNRLMKLYIDHIDIHPIPYLITTSITALAVTCFGWT